MKVGDLVNWYVPACDERVMGLIVRRPRHGDCFFVLVGGDEVIIHPSCLEVISESR